MKDTVKYVIDNVFSFGFLMFVGGLACIYMLVLVDTNAKASNAACYKAGMVKVRTDGGNFCVAPTNLVEME